MVASIYVHPSALNESEDVGKGTRIWAFAHVMKGSAIGENCNVGDHAFVEGGARIGNGVTLKNGVSVWDGVELEDYVFVGPNAVFTNDRFPRSPRNPVATARYAASNWCERTTVRYGASIGANATVVCGISIGRYSLVAAGAVVTKDVPDFSFMAGCPAVQRGYVCACGVTLSGALNRPTCSVCDRTYSLTDQGLALAEGDPI